MNVKDLDVEALRALKLCIKGLTTKEVITEYAVDDETGNLKIVKQKISEKIAPPNVDLLKLIYPKLAEEKSNYEEMTDDELENEKQRLLKGLKEKESVNRKDQNKSKV